MKYTTIAIALLCAAQLGAATHATLSLKDGSTLKAELKTERIDCSAAFAKTLPLDPGIVRSLTFAGTNGEAKVELVNGDRITATVSNPSFAFTSMLGNLTIPIANIRSMTLSAAKTSANGGLVFHCTFDDEAALSSPAVGPAVKIELGKIIEHKGKKGGALFVNPGVAGAEIVFPVGSFGSEGCIEFWANMASGKTEFSTGGDPRFFILLDGNGDEKAHFEYSSNNGCGNSGLGGHFLGMRTQTNTGALYLMPYSDVFKGEDYNGWHHYAYVWTPTSLTIYLDGKLLCSNSGSVNSDALANTVITMDIPLSRTRGKSFNNKSAFLMDELKIWNFAKREFDAR